ncbi:MAG: 2,3-bisphosphoglycerate-independent phosphoglycerate mutase [Lachnospiraceae bacterium]|nr:2,3-bisphosphoglycerate-independent phosphoglycerate mutase [Lachnospiraceae bacterium]
MDKKTNVLLILNGYGIFTGKTSADRVYDSYLKKLQSEYPSSKCLASGMAVGLPNGQMGDSFVGHVNIGAGRIVYQDLSRITKEIQDGTFYSNSNLLETVKYCKKMDSSLHLCGLISDGGTHSHVSHLYALLEFAKKQRIRNVFVHCFMDGVDSTPGKGLFYIERLQAKMREIGVGEIATVSGRYYAMDKGKNYDRLKLAYLAMTAGEGVKAANPEEALSQSYEAGESDEFVKPTVIVNGGVPVGIVNDGDTVIFFNFRPDCSRELLHVFCDEEFRSFKREKKLEIMVACFTEYDISVENKKVIFDHPQINMTFSHWLESNDLTQLKICEENNLLYLNYAFNGYSNDPFEGEEYDIMHPPKIARDVYKLENTTAELTERTCKAISSGNYDFILCDIDTLDAAGHNFNRDNCKKAIDVVGSAVKKICEAVKENDAVLFICSTHGNVEKIESADLSKENINSNTTNPVPFILYNFDKRYCLRNGGCLGDIVPTIIDVMGYEKPKEMTGKSLLVESIPDEDTVIVNIPG